MYCPRCGQQQATSDMRFCSRCGFPLRGVAELLTHGGLVPQQQPQQAAGEVNQISPRRKGVQQGVALILFAVVLTPLMLVLNSYLGFPEVLAALAAIIGFIGGPARVLYALSFEEGAPKKIAHAHYPQPHADLQAYQQPQLAVGSKERATALPPHQSAPVSNWRRPDTAELVRPQSVTENTTKLLDKADDASNLPAE